MRLRFVSALTHSPYPDDYGFSAEVAPDDLERNGAPLQPSNAGMTLIVCSLLFAILLHLPIRIRRRYREPKAFGEAPDSLSSPGVSLKNRRDVVLIVAVTWQITAFLAFLLFFQHRRGVGDIQVHVWNVRATKQSVDARPPLISGFVSSRRNFFTFASLRRFPAYLSLQRD